MKMVKDVIGDYCRISAMFVSLALSHPQLFAGAFVPESDAHNVDIQVAGSSQTIPTQKRKSKKKGRAKRKSVIKKNVAVPLGIWGGDDITMNIQAGGVTIEYSCANGQIEQALRIDGSGNFAADGFYNQEQPGPIRIETNQLRQPARYEGRISEDTMTLKTTLTESGKVVGEFKLVRGKTSRLPRCY
ncbi:MAG: hypothetical protein ACKVQW_07995 [Pyrinomonadaceae bacterium]